MQPGGALDFGYPWWLSYGHLAIFLVAGGLLAAAWRRKWRKLWLAVLFAVAVWSGASAAVMKVILDVNGRAALPAGDFLRRGEGLVLDLGAGTGRSSIMVLDARPKARLVAVDLFGDSFDRHFGRDGNPEERLRANLRAAGHADRAEIRRADLRSLPFAESSFDAAVSAYVIDHLGRQGAAQALGEARRVLKPGGDFLFIVVANDAWTKLAFGPLLVHTTLGAGSWRQSIEAAGFGVVEMGTPPGMLYVLARKQ
jgi:SAM-dependent methyltransferase